MRISFQQKTVIQATILAVSLLIARDVFAQGTRSDYERALNLRKITANKVFKQKVTPHWLPDSIQFWYRNDLADGVREHILVNAETGVRQKAFDHERLATKLTEVIRKDIQANRLPIENLSFDEELTELKFKSHGKWWKCDLHSYDLQELSEYEQDVSMLGVHTRVRPSISGGNETSITFMNHTKGNIQVYWIDFEGERRYYARVRAGRQHRQHTYARHVWLVTDEGGKTLAVFVATEEAGDAVIGDTGTREAAAGRKTTAAKTRGESPDGNWFAFVKDYNLYVRKIETGEEITLSSEGTSHSHF